MIVTVWYRMVVRKEPKKWTRLLEHNHFSNGWSEDEHYPVPVNSEFKQQVSLWKSGDWYKRKGRLEDNTVLIPATDFYYLIGKPILG